MYELAKRLKEEGRTAEEIRTALFKQGASVDEVNVLLGSLGLGGQTHTASPELLVRVKKVTSSRTFTALMLLLMLVAVAPVVWLVYALVNAFRVGR